MKNGSLRKRRLTRDTGFGQCIWNHKDREDREAFCGILTVFVVQIFSFQRNPNLFMMQNFFVKSKEVTDKKSIRRRQEENASPHFSPIFYCGGGSGHVYCVALCRAPRHTVEYACGALGRAPCIHARLRRLATKSGEKCGLECPHRLQHRAFPDLWAHLPRIR
jgi:hypothetical protein